MVSIVTKVKCLVLGLDLPILLTLGSKIGTLGHRYGTRLGSRRTEGFGPGEMSFTSRVPVERHRSPLFGLREEQTHSAPPSDFGSQGYCKDRPRDFGPTTPTTVLSCRSRVILQEKTLLYCPIIHTLNDGHFTTHCFSVRSNPIKSCSIRLWTRGISS